MTRIREGKLRHCDTCPEKPEGQKVHMEGPCWQSMASEGPGAGRASILGDHFSLFVGDLMTNTHFGSSESRN